MIRTSEEDREGFIQALRQIKLRVIRVLSGTEPGSAGHGHLVALPQVPIIKVWYGDNQVFGQNGIPQTWVNVLGNASARSGIARIVYSLNGGPKQQLWIGRSRTRLVILETSMPRLPTQVCSRVRMRYVSRLLPETAKPASI
jgi:hypothetical protein